MIQANHNNNNGDDELTEMPRRDDASFFGFGDEKIERPAGQTFELPEGSAISVMPAWRPIPPVGWVQVLIGKCEVRTPQGGGTKYLHLRYQIPQELTTAEGVKVHRGASATQNLQIWHTSQQASQSACRILAHIARVCGVTIDPAKFSPLDFLGRELEIRVGEQPDYRDRTRTVPHITGHRAISGEHS